MSKTRISFDEYFMNFAVAASHRATCARLKVGAVLVVDNQVVATGYNGSAKGMPHCDDVGCDVVEGHCIRTIHAEMNALAQAAKRGVRIDQATVYTTASPCWNCFRVLVNAGITRYIYAKEYRPDVSKERIEAVVKNNTGISVKRLGEKTIGQILGDCAACGGAPDDRHDHHDGTGYLE